MREIKNVPEGWIQTTLGQISDVTTGFPFKSDDYSLSGELRVVRGENVSLGRLRWESEKFWIKSTKGLEKFFLERGDIVIGMDGSRIGKNKSSVNGEELPLILAQRVARVKATNKNYQGYLKYCILNENFEKYIIKVQTGTSIPHISISQIKNYHLLIPENPKEQQSIAHILTSFDDKIELLQAQNKTLETLAQTIFKEWFGKYQVADELPEGWKIGKLEDVLEIKYGKDHKHLEDGSIPLYGSGGIMRYVEKALYDEESILIPRKGTLSNLFYLNKPFWSVDTMFFTKIKDSYFGRYVFLFLKSLDLSAMNVGSAIPSLTTQVLNQIPLIIPSREIVVKFNDLILPFYKKIDVNNEQIETLTKTRDELLPKLMNGEIRIEI